MIPPDYEAQGVVPICISEVDDEGRPVHRGWIEAVGPVANPIRALARYVMGDVWLSSELAQGTVHMLSRLHGADLGECPSGRIWRDARLRAKDLAAGSRRRRVGLDVQLRDHVLACMEEPCDLESLILDRDFIDRVYGRIATAGRDDVRLIMDLYIADAEDEIAEAFGTTRNSKFRNALSQRFRRLMRKVLNDL
jgi:hypothetical protein